MPTTKPRIALTLEPAQYATLQRMARLQRRPAASIAAEFLGTVFPVLDDIADVLEEAETFQAERRQTLADTFKQAHDASAPVLKGLLALVKGSGEPSAPAAQTEPPKAAITPQPPCSNTGVTFSASHLSTGKPLGVEGGE